MKNKRILIFYMSPQSGHKTAARSLKQCFLQLYPSCDVMDVNFLNYTNPVVERLLFRTYMRIIKSAPTFWDYIYDNQKVLNRMAWMQELSRKINETKMKSLISDFKPDVILNTQCFPCGVVSIFKQQGDFRDIPNIAVITDYVVNSYWIYDHVDHYIVADESMSDKILKKNISPEKVRNFGIPVDLKFRDNHEKKVLIDKYNLEHGKKTLLVMGGNYGFGNIKKLVLNLCHLEEDFQIVVVAGNNRKLLRRLSGFENLFSKTIRIFGYVDTVDELMEVSDIILTKPGGITTAECLVKRLPMIIINPIPGQETRNCDFLVRNRVALKAENEKNAAQIVLQILRDEDMSNAIKERIELIRKPSATINIVEMVMGL